MTLVATLMVEILPIKSQAILLNSCFCDAFGKIPPKKEIKYKRNFKNLKNEEYIEELHKINWSILDHFDTENAFKALIHQHDSLLNVMALFNRSTKRELRLEIRP